jgi:hypothetical protein
VAVTVKFSLLSSPYGDTNLFIVAKPVTFTTTLKDYGGNGAYLAFYVTDKDGAYAGSLWMAGGKSKYYKHLANWYQATGGDRAQIKGITGVGKPAARKAFKEIKATEVKWNGRSNDHLLILKVY